VVRTHSGATDGPDFNRGFSLAPDAGFFVISLKTGEGYDLFVHDGSTGAEIRRLTTTGGSAGVHNLYPDVSPDGRWVAFSGKANVGARPDLYMVRVDGTGLRRITDTPDASEDRPSWSPDGAEVAYQGQIHTEAAPNWDIFAIAVLASAPVAPAGIRQLTTDPGAQLDPAWDPRGGAIVFTTYKPGATDRPNDIGAVAPDGTNERVLATGPNRDIGIGGELSWVGKTGLLMTNERISIHEYMTFDSAKAPFDRSASNGGDAAFTQSLVIPGGMGGDGVTVSRDGKTVMWMIRTSHNPASWVVTIRTADVGALNGQSAIDFGNVVWTHSGATDGPNIPRGFSLAPDAGFFVMSTSIQTADGSRSGEGYDLFVLDGSTGEEIRRLTTTGGSAGVHNLYPDVSPDGRWVAFSSKSNAEARPDLYIVRVDGTGLRQVTNTSDASEDRPSWSPDGAEIAYQGLTHTDASPNWDIFAIAVASPSGAIIPTPAQTPVPAIVPTATAAPTPAPLAQEQFATSATASSTWNPAWSAMEATGAPYELRYGEANICGDTTAWSPLEGINPEWLEARFELPVFATGLTVYEPFNSGFIYQVDLIDTDGTYHTVWTGTDSTDCPGKFALTFAQTSYKVVGVKIYTQHDDFEEIDAVKLIGGVN
jgi:hypothetical protein